MATSMYQLSKTENPYDQSWDPLGYSHKAQKFLLPVNPGFVGKRNARHEHLGSYIPAAVYTQGCLPGPSTNSYATRSRKMKQPSPLFYHQDARGLDSGSTMASFYSYQQSPKKSHADIGNQVHILGSKNSPWTNNYGHKPGGGDPRDFGLVRADPVSVFIIHSKHLLILSPSRKKST
jgi:hypothetical protein